MNKISIILPVFNAEQYLVSAINSILNQSFQEFEFIIINDGSNDGTAEILNSFEDKRIRVINQSNKGLVFSLNYGVKISNGDWIARMDADDISYPNRLEEQLKYINDDVAVIGSQAHIIDQNDKIHSTTKFELEHDKIISKLLKLESTIIHPSVLINKAKFILTGGYDLKMLAAEDTDLWLRISRIGRIINIDKPLIGLRKHDNNISKINLQEAIINSHISLAHYFRSDSIHIMSEKEYNLLFDAVVNFTKSYNARIIFLEKVKVQIKILSSISKYLFVIVHPYFIINYLVMRFQRLWIIFKIRSISK